MATYTQDVRIYSPEPRSPSVAELLDTLVGAAHRFEPAESDFRNAATETRQRNIKTDYLRGFGHLLIRRGLELTPPIMRAMAITTTVVINDPEIDATYDDVRKVLATLP
jgi:hypothetical protein